jgi:hypothetical protein
MDINMEDETQTQEFSPETIELLKKQLEDLNNIPNIDLSEYKYIFDDPNKVKKQTDAQYEIHINLTANVLENIPGAEFPESKNICTNNYFIPVPSGHDHHEYLKAFFDHIENCMTSSASSASEKNSNDQ